MATLQAIVVELQATVADQRVTIVDPRAANVRLEERDRDFENWAGQHSGNSSRPPSSDLPGTPKRPPTRPSGWGRGGQTDHVAHQRAMASPERGDVVADHWPLHWQACQARLTVLPQTPGLPGLAGAPDFVAHQMTELPVIHSRVTEYRLHRLACVSCGTRTRASLSAGVPTVSFGSRLVPTRLRSVDVPRQGTGVALVPVTAALVSTLPWTPLVHADGTRWPHDGHNWWLWMVRSAQATVFVL